ncbi:MAG: isopenicillin N synthase family oxygenase [Bacteroidetes bacterium]|nr:isopenicillin N synthase family oxygenase [Bacteroidota bacterium]
MSIYTQSIPCIDLNLFMFGSAAEKSQFVQNLGNAFETIGFVAVKGHLLSDELAGKLYESAKSFFSLPSETKLQYEIEGLYGQRGYTSFGKEHAKGQSAGDLKEFWHFGQDLPFEVELDRNDYPDNILVKETPEFNTAGLEAYMHLEKTGIYMLRAIALYLGLDEFYFDAKVEYGQSILRPIHYGPIVGEPVEAVRAAAHEDINLITLLMGASADGLEVLNKSGQWIQVTALPEQIICNVGDMLQRLTNNKLKSTTHRVVNPPRALWNTSRYSIPFFMHPLSGMSLACLPSCVGVDNPKHYEDCTAGQFLDERLREIGLK